MSPNRKTDRIYEVIHVPCQCQNPTVANQVNTPQSGCECGTESAGGCQCGTGAPTPAEGVSLERVVMELDRRVRKLEAGH